MGYCISITWKDLLPFPTYLGAFTRFFHFVVVVFWGFFVGFGWLGFLSQTGSEPMNASQLILTYIQVNLFQIQPNFVLR